MAENKKSFILYVDLISVVEKLIVKDRLNKTNYAGELFYAILRYVNDKELIDIDFIVELAFEPIKLSLKRDLKKFEITKNERSESAKIGNLKRWHNDLYLRFKKGEKTLKECESEINNRKSSHSDYSDTVAKKEIANIAESVNDIESVNDSVNDINKPLPKKTEKVFSEEVLNCFNNCLVYFPENLHPKKNKNWLESIEKLHRLDKIPFSEIERITKLARADDFTSKNVFHSLPKLRSKKNEISYFNIFKEKFKTTNSFTKTNNIPTRTFHTNR